METTSSNVTILGESSPDYDITYVKFMTLDPKSLMDRAKTENIHFNGFFSTPTLVSKNEMHGMVSMKPSA